MAGPLLQTSKPQLMSAKELQKLPVHPVPPPLSNSLLDQLARANAMLSLAANERRVLRTALSGCIAALEDLQSGHPQDPLFAEHADASKALKHARQLLRPGGADRAMAKKAP